MVVPVLDLSRIEEMDLYVADHHFATPDFCRRAGKTGMQPHITPIEISTVLDQQVSATRLNGDNKSTHRTM